MTLEVIYFIGQTIAVSSTQELKRESPRSSESELPNGHC